jgi:hypothetical protein
MSSKCGVKNCTSSVAPFLCSKCKLQRYCSPTHQKENWKSHKAICVPASTIVRDTIAIKKCLHDYIVTAASDSAYKKMKEFVDNMIVFRANPVSGSNEYYGLILSTCSLLAEKDPKNSTKYYDYCVTCAFEHIPSMLEIELNVGNQTVAVRDFVLDVVMHTVSAMLSTSAPLSSDARTKLQRISSGENYSSVFRLLAHYALGCDCQFKDPAIESIPLNDTKSKDFVAEGILVESTTNSSFSERMEHDRYIVSLYEDSLLDCVVSNVDKNGHFMRALRLVYKECFDRSSSIAENNPDIVLTY